MRRKKPRFAIEFFIWVFIAFVVGLSIGGIFFMVLTNNSSPIESIEVDADFSPNAILINGEWKYAPLITWRNDPDDSEFLLIYLNDLQGHADGRGDHIDVYRIPREDFNAVMHVSVE